MGLGQDGCRLATVTFDTCLLGGRVLIRALLFERHSVLQRKASVGVSFQATSNAPMTPWTIFRFIKAIPTHDLFSDCHSNTLLAVGSQPTSSQRKGGSMPVK
jgi:hypothetical protein